MRRCLFFSLTRTFRWVRSFPFAHVLSVRFCVIYCFLSAIVLPAGAQKTVEDRVQEYGTIARKRWAPYFKQADILYPPRAITLIGLKQEKLLEVWAAGTNGAFRFVRSYPIRAASGNLGPKLRQGDKQVPEGLYRIESLNPNSSYHLSLRVNYPNEDDRKQAQAERRTNLGGDIMIHGRAVSVGCLAMGDEAAEDLFVLAALTGVSNIEVILSPIDFRVRDLQQLPEGAPAWTAERYGRIKAALAKYAKQEP
jgi:L,D-transpeptidase catalytic domain